MGGEGAQEGCTGLVVVPAVRGQSEESSDDPDVGTIWSACVTVFEAESVLGGVEDRLDHLTDRSEQAGEGSLLRPFRDSQNPALARRDSDCLPQ